ncbi:hypothetical protein [uncultured Methanobrevibacter sp.]|uniref:hypothetical protein n=1 Tax=uncultured Methanobrevibacter sp. TaxID=253161 RepID=UPI0025E607F3|nr:hypothetical protein [uncultured Methanobrevibacter sp.]
MNEEIYKKKLERIKFTLGCRQSSEGIEHKVENDFVTEKLYIHQIIIKRDIKDRYEQLYSIKYDDYIFNETKIIENKTYSGLVNFMDKQKVISEVKKVSLNIYYLLVLLTNMTPLLTE